MADNEFSYVSDAQLLIRTIELGEKLEGITTLALRGSGLEAVYEQTTMSYVKLMDEIFARDLIMELKAKTRGT